MNEDRPAKWREVRNLLCVRLDNLGDVLMTSPALRAVRGDGARRVTLLASTSGAAAARWVPSVDEVLCYDAPWIRHEGRSAPEVDLAMVERLAARKFDAAILFTVYSQSPLASALLCRLAGIPLCLAHCRENPYRLLTDWVPETEPQNGVRHEVQRQLDLVATIGAFAGDTHLGIEVPAEAHEAIERLLVQTGIDSDETLVVLHPGASASSRRYPAAQFAEAVRVLARKRRCRIVVTGGRSEREVAQTVCAAAGRSANAWNAAGKLDLPRLAALIARASLLISNNTGPVHVAAAVGTPVVVLYALTNPQHTPWQVPHRTLFRDVPCRYCYKSVCPEGHNACLRLVAPAEIAAAAIELLDGGASIGAMPPAPSVISVDPARAPAAVRC